MLQKPVGQIAGALWADAADWESASGLGLSPSSGVANPAQDAILPHTGVYARTSEGRNRAFGAASGAMISFSP